MWREFKAFLIKQNILALALAVVMGVALGKVVTALVNDFIMPIAGVLTPGGDWRAAMWGVGPIQFAVGDFAGAVIDFLIIGFVVWQITKALIKPDPTTTHPCAYCRMAVDVAATRCPHCTSPLTAAAIGSARP